MFYRSANLIITSIVMGCLAIVAVALRLWAGTVRRMGRGAEDILIIIGLILALVLCICNIVGAALSEVGYLPFQSNLLVNGGLKIFYVIQLLHATAMPIIKASLMLFLRRIFGHMRAFRLAFWLVGVYVFLWWLTTFWMSVFQCWPISANWSKEMQGCIPNYWTWYCWAALLNVMSDVAIITIPIPFVWGLQMPLRQRVVTLSILTTAMIVIIAGIGRTVGYFTWDPYGPDYVSYDVYIWTTIEPCLGVVGCCLPTLGPLIDLKHSAVYSKIKSMFPWQSLLGKSTSEANGNRSVQRTAWVKLTNEGHNQSELMV